MLSEVRSLDPRKLAVYHVFDTDGSGEMDFEEFREGVQRVGPDPRHPATVVGR